MTWLFHVLSSRTESMDKLVEEINTFSNLADKVSGRRHDVDYANEYKEKK